MSTTPNVKRNYDSSRAMGWTRVEMVLELYRSAIRRTQLAVQCERDGDSTASQSQRLHAVRTVQGIVAGLNLNQGEIPQNIARLCEYVQRGLLSKEVSQWEDAIRILQTLAEGFEGIREQANAMEESGQIPAMQHTSSFESWA